MIIVEALPPQLGVSLTCACARSSSCIHTILPAELNERSFGQARPAIRCHEKFATCIDACLECANACEHCATACLNEKDVAHMAKCIEIERYCDRASERPTLECGS